jgi:hypothetical protein
VWREKEVMNVGDSKRKGKDGKENVIEKNAKKAEKLKEGKE